MHRLKSTLRERISCRVRGGGGSKHYAFVSAPCTTLVNGKKDKTTNESSVITVQDANFLKYKLVVIETGPLSNSSILKTSTEFHV